MFDLIDDIETYRVHICSKCHTEYEDLIIPTFCEDCGASLSDCRIEDREYEETIAG